MKTPRLLLPLFLVAAAAQATPVGDPMASCTVTLGAADTRTAAQSKAGKKTQPHHPEPPAAPSTPAPRREPPARPPHLFM